MKTYMKPSLDIVELRPEERLAGCHYFTGRGNGQVSNQSAGCSIVGDTSIS